MGKLLFNPDAVGQLIQGRLSNTLDDAGQALKDWGNKIVGNKPDKSQEQKNIEDIVGGRIAKNKADLNKKDYIAKAKGLTSSEPDLGLRKTQPTMPSMKSTIALLTPPDIHNYGFKDPTIMEDVGRWFQGLIRLDKGIYTPQQYVQYMKKYNPELYKRYDDELNVYEMRKA